MDGGTEIHDDPAHTARLLAIARGTASDADRAAAAPHLADCPLCRQTILTLQVSDAAERTQAALAQVASTLDALLTPEAAPQPTAPEAEASRLPRGRRLWAGARPVPLLLAALGGAAATAGLLVVLRRPPIAPAQQLAAIPAGARGVVDRLARPHQKAVSAERASFYKDLVASGTEPKLAHLYVDILLPPADPVDR